MCVCEYSVPAAARGSTSRNGQYAHIRCIAVSRLRPRVEVELATSDVSGLAILVCAIWRQGE